MQRCVPLTDACHFFPSRGQSKPPCIEWLFFRPKLDTSEADWREFDFQLGANAICEAWALQAAVIPAKAGIYSASLWKRAVVGLDSSRHGGTGMTGGSVTTRRSAKPCLMSSLTRSACPDWPPVLSFTRRTAVYGPVRTVVWEGRAGNRSPDPDQGQFLDAAWLVV